MQKVKQTYYLLDFDSTFIKSEGLDALAEIALHDHPEKKEVLEKIKNLTNLGMEGKIPFNVSLSKRIQLIQSNKAHVLQVGRLLKKKISTSILSNKAFFTEHKENIFIISGGFREFILPVVKQFGIKPDHVFANTFVFDVKGNVTGIDTANLMSQDNGKVKVVQSLNLKKDLYIIGDGHTDYELRKQGLAKKFIVFTENIERSIVVSKADEVAPTFDEFLYVNNLPSSLSYPKNRITVLVMKQISKSDKEIFAKEGYKIIYGEGLSNQKLFTLLQSTAILCVDNQDQLSADILQHAQRLLAIGMYGNTEEQTSHTFLHQKGIYVINTSHTTKRLINFINTGNTDKSLTLPNIKLSPHKNAHRLLHLHKNVPGILAQINTIMAKNDMNIISQYLETNQYIGYAITDVDKTYNKNVLKLLKKVPNTIRFRVLY